MLPTLSAMRLVAIQHSITTCNIPNKMSDWGRVSSDRERFVRSASIVPNAGWHLILKMRRH
jgi:hypothetical protein